MIPETSEAGRQAPSGELGREVGPATGHLVLASDDQGADAGLGPPRPTVLFHPLNGLFLALGLALVVVAVRRRPVPRLVRGGATLSLLLALLALLLTPFAALHSFSILAWEAAMLGLMGAALCGGAGPRPSRPRWLLSVVIGATALSRLAWLTTCPPRVHVEEAWFGMWARYAAQGRTAELFGTIFFDIPLLTSAFDGGLMKVFADGLFGLRLGSVVMGTAVVGLTLGLAGRLHGRLGPAFAATLFVASHHAIHHYGRVGMGNIDGVLAVVATAYFVVRAVRGGGWVTALGGGAAAGVLVQSYHSSRLAPILALSILALEVPWPSPGAAPASRARRLAVVGAFLLGLVAALAPLLLVYAREPELLGGRERGVVVISVADLVRDEGGARARLWRSVVGTLWLHTVGHDDDAHYGAEEPFVPYLLLPLVAYGLWRLARRPAELRARLVLCWVGIALAIGALPLRDLLIRRTLVIVPALGLALAEAMEGLASVGDRRRRAATAMAWMLIAVSAVDQLDYTLRRHPRAFPMDLSSGLGRYLATHRGSDVQLLTLPDVSIQDVYVQLMGDPTRVREVERMDALGPGPVIVSAVHAGLVAELTGVLGGRLEARWGPLPETGAVPTREEAYAIAPVVVTLPDDFDAARAARGRLRLLGPDDRPRAAPAVPLLAYDYRRDRTPRLRAVEIETSVSGPGTMAVAALARDASTRVTVDGVATAAAAELRLGPGAHRVTARFEPRAGRDSFQLRVRTGAGAVCCAVPVDLPSAAGIR